MKDKNYEIQIEGINLVRKRIYKSSFIGYYVFIMIDASKRDFFLIFGKGWNFKYILKFLKKFFLYGFILMVCL